jgi:hypothetical protein
MFLMVNHQFPHVYGYGKVPTSSLHPLNAAKVISKLYE